MHITNGMQQQTLAMTNKDISLHPTGTEKKNVFCSRTSAHNLVKGKNEYI
jgi:hypothetical protein